MGEARELVSALEVIVSKEKTAPGDVFKSFNHFFRANDEKIAKNVDAILEHFHPSNHMRRIIRVRLIDKCRASAEVVKILQRGHWLEKKRALGCKWFFESLEDPQNFVTNATLTLSYNVRVKVINKYAAKLQSSSSGEELYLAMKSKYGVKSASILLPACGGGFVGSELASLTDTILSPPLTLALLKKHPSPAKEYIWRIVEHPPRKLYNRKPFTFFGYEPVFHRISQIDLPLFLNIYEKHREKIPYLSLRRKTLRKLQKFHLNRVLNNDNFKKLLNLTQLIKELSLSDAKRVYTNWVLPATVTEFFEVTVFHYAYRILDHFKSPARQDILWSGFRLKYKIDPFADECLLKMRKLWINLLPLAAKEKYVERKTTQSCQPEKLAKYLAFLPFDRSMARLKCIMESNSNENVRLATAAQMVRCVRHNECPKELKGVISYTLNVDNSGKMKKCLISELCVSEQLLLQLEMSNWDPIDELLNSISPTEFERIDWSIIHIMKIQVRCCFLRNLNAEPLLEKLLDYLKSHRDMLDHEVKTFENTSFQIIWIEWLLKKLPGIEWRSRLKRSSVILCLLQQIDNWNQTHKLNPVVLPENFVRLLESTVHDCQQDDDDYSPMLKYIKHYPVVRNRLLELSYPQIAVHKDTTLCSLLKHNPILVIGKLSALAEILFTKRFKEYIRFYSQCRLYESYGIPQQLIQCCRMSLMLDNQEYSDVSNPLLQISTQPHAIQVLSVLLEPPEYLDAVHKYFSAQKTVSSKPKFHDMTRFLRALFVSLERISRPRETLPLLEQFATSSHIKAFVRSSLNNICFQLSDKALLPVLRSWTGPIETQPIVLGHIYRISSLEALIDLPKNAKKRSLQHCSFRAFRKIFNCNPTCASFNVLSSMLKQLKREEILMEEVLCLNNSNYTHISSYLMLVWNRIDSDWSTDITQDRRKLLEAIDENVIDVLDHDFYDLLLKYELSNQQNFASKFIHLCLLCPKKLAVFNSNVNQIVAALIPIIRSDAEKYEVSEGNVIEVCQTLSEFVYGLCKESLTCNSKNASGNLKRVKDALSSVVERKDFLKESYWMDAHILYHNLKSRDQLREYTSALEGLQKEYVEANEAVFTAVLSDVVPTVTTYCSSLSYKLNTVSEHPLSQIVAAEVRKNGDSDDESNCDSVCGHEAARRTMDEMLRSCKMASDDELSE